jgi:hypothetical protein
MKEWISLHFKAMKAAKESLLRTGNGFMRIG